MAIKRSFEEELQAIKDSFEPKLCFSCASAPGNSGGATARATPSTTAGASAVCRCGTPSQYNIDLLLHKAQRIAHKLHSIPSLYPDDRQLLVNLQSCIKEAKKQNNYEPNARLDLFPP